jgi:hypothetical protein
MPEYNVICAQCSHTPHTNKKCATCGCDSFVRLDVAAIRLLDMNVTATQEVAFLLKFQNTLLGEIYPEQFAAVKARLYPEKGPDDIVTQPMVPTQMPTLAASSDEPGSTLEPIQAAGIPVAVEIIPDSVSRGSGEER